MEMPQMQETVSKKLSSEEYAAIVQSPSFQKLLHEKKKFIIPFTIFFFCFYFALPIMTSYTDVLTKSAFGNITWAWVFAFMQFVMTWAFCMIYYKKANTFDRLSQQVIEKQRR
ncbi:DUF485 domain-containing protein [Bacillus sp. 1P06AnD]|uniref:DUF485 domain-containing protein n=1 Tax=Bacillus sp. 1P06AnD TaxID=3132208 RepID=UPI0039A24E21